MWSGVGVGVTIDGNGVDVEVGVAVGGTDLVGMGIIGSSGASRSV
jgi:hypothetical protein